MSLFRWATAFAFTQLVEVPIYRRMMPEASFGRAFGASLATHPIVWIVAVESGWHASWLTRTVACELFALIVETIWFVSLVGLRRAAWASLVANATSFGLGLVAYRLFGL